MEKIRCEMDYQKKEVERQAKELDDCKHGIEVHFFFFFVMLA